MSSPIERQAAWGRYRFCLDPTQPFIVVDLETTGLDPQRHQIIEIAAIRIVPGEERWSGHRWLVRCSRKIPAAITQLTGIDDDLLEREGCQPHEALSDVVRYVRDWPIVSFNAAFDLSFLNVGLDRHALPVQKRGGHSCALRLARKTWPGLSSYKLAYLSRLYGLDVLNEHRATGDAVRAAHLYRMAAADHRARRSPERAWPGVLLG